MMMAAITMIMFEEGFIESFLDKNITRKCIENVFLDKKEIPTIIGAYHLTSTPYSRLARYFHRYEE